MLFSIDTSETECFRKTKNQRMVKGVSDKWKQRKHRQQK